VSKSLLAEAEAWDHQAAGLRWDLNQIKRLVTNPAYAALRVHNGRVVGPADWPAILDESMYTACVERLSDPRRRSVRDPSVRHLLSGALKCGECGSRMRVQKNRGYFTYICVEAFHVAVKTTNVEEYVTALVLERLARPDLLDLLAPPSNEDEVTAASAEAADLRARLEGFYEQAAIGKISPSGMATIEARLLPAIEAAESRSRRATSVSPLVRSVAGPGAAAAWEGLSIAQRREVVSLLAELRITRTGRGARRFDRRRLGASRWVGDDRSWMEIWDAAEASDRAS
jgi:hypothetical protein